MNTLGWNERARQPAKVGKPEHPRLAEVPAPHIDSFNSIFDAPVRKDAAGRPGKSLLQHAVADVRRAVIFDGDQYTLGQGLAGRNKLEVWVDEITVAKPQFDGAKAAESRPLFPFECRAAGSSYRGKIQAVICTRHNGGPIIRETKHLGYLPIMIRSRKCNLEGVGPHGLIAKKEDTGEFGGYFLVNGNERLIRLLIVPRRNHPIAIVRGSFQKRGPTYSQFGVQIRCCRPDQSSQSVTLHYLTDGALNLRFSYNKSEYMVPVMLILRALQKCSDREVFERIVMKDREPDTFLTDRVELLLRSFQQHGVFSQSSCLELLGSKFHVMLDSPEDMSEEDVGRALLKKIILVHLEKDEDKFNLLICMIQKLYALVGGECATDNPDSPQHQEILLGGHLYLMYFKEKVEDVLQNFKLQVLQDLRRGTVVAFDSKDYLRKVWSRVNLDVGKHMDYFLATGNLRSRTGLDLQQTSGYTIIAEKLNFYRYISHFHSVHRGAFFAELKTTTVRKLLPEAWGFLCPVHTPDGAPCGLLNHLSHTCKIVIGPVDVSTIPALVASLGIGGMAAGGPRVLDGANGHTNGRGARNGYGSDKEDEEDDEEDEGRLDPAAERAVADRRVVTVQLDGRVLGWCSAAKARSVARTLRHLKFSEPPLVPKELEIGLVYPSKGGQYPGLFLFSSPARMMRPVTYLANGAVDLVGSFEQVYMEIACMKEDVVPGSTTHMETHPTSMLSVVASLTPFSDFNQSPRNMYQCQMGKQAMGTPANNFPNRTDNKLYRLQTGQTPVVRPLKQHADYGLDDYPNGMNAVVAVIAYTGYDMEDASILSKSSFERGYGYGTVYKSEFIDLSERRSRGEEKLYFGLSGTLNNRTFEMIDRFLDMDGLPKVGVMLSDGDPYYAYVDPVTGRCQIKRFKGMETAYVDEVRIIGEGDDDQIRKVHIKLRIPRPPIIGDKFSSRHGQKGVISQKWPSVDMPFSESGIIPDVIINPHAFPSRMTIGMFVESLAGKSGALHGKAQDATPFQFNEDHAAADYFGEELKEAGFNYHGNEPMYSGITGKEFKADIYIGVVYYQRLRHMVSDKYQVRTTGPIDPLTQQPIKGRKKSGGIRLGEMERDSLLAHGVSFILQDRLMNCSDYTQCHVCRLCGSILTPVSIRARARREWEASTGAAGGEDVLGVNGSLEGPRRDAFMSTMKTVLTEAGARGEIECSICETSRGVAIVAVPYVFRYLCTELVAMNIKLKLELT
ncbi:hypothetical protein HK101_007823 [Irineochytrium annulatum]|nr:hypothetical protein HK101_007823 [Irineochytrium annulatum]